MHCAQVEGRGGIHLCVLPPGANLTFSNQTNGSALLFWQNIFTWPVREACNTLWSARCLIWKAFSCEWVDIRPILTKKNFPSADRFRQNDSMMWSLTEKEKTTVRYSMWAGSSCSDQTAPGWFKAFFPHLPSSMFFFYPKRPLCFLRQWKTNNQAEKVGNLQRGEKHRVLPPAESQIGAFLESSPAHSDLFWSGRTNLWDCKCKKS